MIHSDKYEPTEPDIPLGMMVCQSAGTTIYLSCPVSFSVLTFPQALIALEDFSKQQIICKG